MSTQRTIFETEIKKPAPDWIKAIDNLNALAMFEMLPSLDGLNAELREEVVSQAWSILSVDRNWRGSYERIQFASEVVTNQQVNRKDTRVASEQITDAVNFLIAHLTPRPTKAVNFSFLKADEAAITALREIIPLTNAIGVEYAGSIYSQGGKYRFTRPQKGEAMSSPSNVPIPAGSTAIGTYHTHPNNNPNSENFSPGDIAIARGNSAAGLPPRISYLGTPSGSIKKLTPPELLSGRERDNYPLFGKPETLR